MISHIANRASKTQTSQNHAANPSSSSSILYNSGNSGDSGFIAPPFTSDLSLGPNSSLHSGSAFVSDCINPQRSLSLLGAVYSRDFHLQAIDLSSSRQITEENSEIHAVLGIENEEKSKRESEGENQDEQQIIVKTTDTPSFGGDNHDSMTSRADVLSLPDELSSVRTAKVSPDQSQASKEYHTLVHIFQENVIADIVGHAPPEVLPNLKGSRFASSASYISAVQAHATKSEQRSAILRAFEIEVTTGEDKEHKGRERKHERKKAVKSLSGGTKSPSFPFLEQENRSAYEDESKICVPLELLSSVDRLALGLRLGNPTPLSFNPQSQTSTLSESTSTPSSASISMPPSSSAASITHAGTTSPFGPSSLPYHTSFLPMFDSYESSWREYMGEYRRQHEKRKKVREMTEMTETTEMDNKEKNDTLANTELQQESCQNQRVPKYQPDQPNQPNQPNQQDQQD